jgi:hypothetical protein
VHIRERGQYLFRISGVVEIASGKAEHVMLYQPGSRPMSEDFEPRNELEKSLLAAQNEEISSDDLLNILMNSQVFMPVQDDKPAVLNIQRSSRAQPLVLNAEDGTPILVLFSSPERAKEFISDYPGFGGGILTEFTWVLEKMGRDFGIALNPGLDVGFDMEPETVNELVDSLGQQARH